MKFIKRWLPLLYIIVAAVNLFSGFLTNNDHHTIIGILFLLLTEHQFTQNKLDDLRDTVIICAALAPFSPKPEGKPDER